MSGVLRIGVLGAARIARSALIEPARLVPSVSVTAVATRDPGRAQTFGLQHGIPAAYGSYEELLAAPDVERYVVHRGQRLAVTHWKYLGQIDNLQERLGHHASISALTISIRRWQRTRCPEDRVSSDGLVSRQRGSEMTHRLA